MSASNSAESAVLALILNNVAWAGVGDATGLRGSSAAGNTYLALHTADPGEAGSQTTNEVAYPGYGRVAVTRAGTGWNVSGNTATLAAAASFPLPSGGSDGVATHFSVGTDATGAGAILFSGAVTPNIAFGPALAPPQLTTGTTITAD